MSDEPIWNVRLTVIDLVPAATAEDAIAKAAARARQVGLDLFAETGYEHDAFESEDLGSEVENKVRVDWSSEFYVTRQWPSRRWVVG